jgi:hypothetical protein
MFEQPTLTYIGEVKDVVLGLAAVGSDIDGSWVMDNFEFLEDFLIAVEL